MKRITIALLLAALTISGQAAETKTPETKRTPESLRKLRQEFLSWKFGMFLHFNMATFNNQQWAGGYEDPATFAPDKLDCGQWADAAKAAGMKYAVLTVKHTGGWCLWDSQYTTHDITAFQNYKNGKGDIVREFVDAFRARGLKVGFYYCAPGNYDGHYGNALPKGNPSLHGLPPEAAGDFAGFIKKQFTELLTNYGPIDLVWVDQFGHTGRRWSEIKAHINSLQPNCLVIANNSHDFRQTDIYSYELPLYKGGKGLPVAENKSSSEVCDCICYGWFWEKAQEEMKTLHNAADIVASVHKWNSRKANYLLNVPPDITGRIPEYSVKRLQEVGKLLTTQGNGTQP